MKSRGRFGFARCIGQVLLLGLLVASTLPAVSASASPLKHVDPAGYDARPQPAVFAPALEETAAKTAAPQEPGLASSTELTATGEIIQVVATADGCRLIRSLSSADGLSAGDTGQSILECDGTARKAAPQTEGPAPDTAPPVPSLLSPADNSTVNTLLPPLRIDAGVSNVQISPNIRVARDPNFNQTVEYMTFCGWSRPSSLFQYIPFENFEPDTRYYWRARSAYGNACGNRSPEWSAWSPAWSFVSGSNGAILPGPQLVSPANGSTIPDIRPTCPGIPSPAQPGRSLWGSQSIISTRSTLGA